MVNVILYLSSCLVWWGLVNVPIWNVIAGLARQISLHDYDCALDPYSIDFVRWNSNFALFHVQRLGIVPRLQFESKIVSESSWFKFKQIKWKYAYHRYHYLKRHNWTILVGFWIVVGKWCSVSFDTLLPMSVFDSCCLQCPIQMLTFEWQSLRWSYQFVLLQSQNLCTGHAN